MIEETNVHGIVCLKWILIMHSSGIFKQFLSWEVKAPCECIGETVKLYLGVKRSLANPVCPFKGFSRIFAFLTSFLHLNMSFGFTGVFWFHADEWIITFEQEERWGWMDIFNIFVVIQQFKKTRLAVLVTSRASVASCSFIVQETFYF